LPSSFFFSWAFTPVAASRNAAASRISAHPFRRPIHRLIASPLSFDPIGSFTGMIAQFAASRRVVRHRLPPGTGTFLVAFGRTSSRLVL